MKFLFVFLVVFSGSGTLNAQSLNFDLEYDMLLQNLESENWADAYKRSRKLLEFAEKNDKLDQERKVLRYIQIFSSAGLLNEKIISKEEALKRVDRMKGLVMAMPAHLFRKDCHVNCTWFTEQIPNTFFTGVNNAKGTQIFAFEYVTIKDRIRETSEDLEGKYVILEGVLNEAAVEGNILPRYKLKFIDGTYEVVKE